MAQQFYISTGPISTGGLRLDPPCYQLYVGILPGFSVLGFTSGYFGPFVSLTGIAQVYMTGSSGIQYRDILATDNPATFPASAAFPLAVLNLDAVGRIQRITDYTH